MVDFIKSFFFSDNIAEPWTIAINLKLRKLIFTCKHGLADILILFLNIIYSIHSFIHLNWWLLIIPVFLFIIKWFLLKIRYFHFTTFFLIFWYLIIKINKSLSFILINFSYRLKCILFEYITIIFILKGHFNKMLHFI